MCLIRGAVTAIAVKTVSGRLDPCITLQAIGAGLIGIKGCNSRSSSRHSPINAKLSTNHSDKGLQSASNRVDAMHHHGIGRNLLTTVFFGYQ